MGSGDGSAEIRRHPAFPDRTSPLTTPYDPVKVQMNTIGGFDLGGGRGSGSNGISRCRRTDIIRWCCARGRTYRGMKSYRRLTIDGAVPYTSARRWLSGMTASGRWWNSATVRSRTIFHLTAGRHTIRLEAVLGEIEYSAAVLKEALTGLNTLYRRVVMITGTVPIPCGIIRCIPRYPTWGPPCAVMRRLLTDEIERIGTADRQRGSEASFLRFAEQLISFADKPDTIPERLSYFKSNISACPPSCSACTSSRWNWTRSPLATAGYALPRANANFFEQAAHEIKAFAASFFNDYAAVGARRGRKP